MYIPINLVFEDAISEFIMLKLLNSFGNKFFVGTSFPGYGFGYIKSNINGFNQAAVATPFFVLTDLDKYECPVNLMQEWLPAPQKPNLLFRVAVREVEAWILADIEGFSSYIGVSKVNFPEEPEKEPDPKRTLIELVKRSRKRLIKEDIIPINNNAKIGPNYNDRLMDFVGAFWDIERAIGRSESLKRTYRRLNQFQYNIPV